MKFLKSKGLLLAIVLTLALPVIAFAQTDDGTQNVENDKKVIHEKVKDKWKKHHKRDHFKLGIHKGMYFQLLAEKYTPEQANEWNEVLDERKQLMQEMKSLKADKKHALKEAHKEKMKELREKVKNGELTKEEAKAMLKDKVSMHKAKHQDNYEVIKQFNEAVAGEEAAAIKASLPQMLEIFKSQNEHLKQVIASMKE